MHRKLARMLTALAAAGALAPPALALDLVQAWEGALQHAPDAMAAQAARAAGVARGQQARALWRPTVQVEGGVSYASSESAVRGARFGAPAFGASDGVAFDTSVTGGTATRYGLALRQPVYSRERSARGEALAIAARAADIAWAQARRDLMLRTVDSYLRAALAAERLRLLQRQQQAVDRAATEARDRFQIGDRPVIDVHEASARAAALTADRLVAATLLEASREALADLTGLASETAPLALPGEVPAADLAPLADWLARAERGNAGLQLAQAQLESAQAQARASASEFSPTVDVVAQLARDRLSGSGDFGSASNTARNGAIGVQVAVPLSSGGLRSAQHAEHLARVDQARAELEGARLDVVQQVRAAWLELSVGRSRTQALAAAVTASRARLDATRVGLQAGDRTTLDLLNAENDAAASELALQEARAGLLARGLRLAALAGELDDSTLQQANAQLQPPRSE